MIEVKDLRKQYKPKKGEVVNALNGVSLQIEEKGLVFILGKSGSGKSTLLNLLGGLDKYDSGDILIKGKSTEEFTQSNFDSYRNTMVGFVFQEYNLLDDFSVGANIALAIELQGDKATDQEVNQILKQVDLEGYGNRKTNELSGGQKQRVAIARALVKNPEIILADEPTGALDSNTGIQIFNILKELAKDKLVLVVSHDRDFAEKYGDRVIELQDGVVISDIKKVAANDTATDLNKLNYFENEGFVVGEDYKLTESDLKQINDYLKKYKKIEIKTKEVSTSGDSLVFIDTKDNIDIKEYDQNFDMVKSKLPLPMAFKMGASGLKHKKVRLVFTVLLSMVAFVLFGIADTLASYNNVEAFTNSIIDSNITDLIFSKEKLEIKGDDEYSWETYNHLGMNNTDLLELERLTGLKYNPVYSVKNYVDELPYTFELYLGSSYQRPYYYKSSINGFINLNQEEISKQGFVLYGDLPKNENEIVIPTFMFEHFQKYGYENFDKDVSISSDKFKEYKDAIGLEIKFENYSEDSDLSFVIKGVLDTGFKSDEFDKIKKANTYDFVLEQSLMSKLSYSYHNLVIISDDKMESLIRNLTENVKLRNGSVDINIEDSYYSYNKVKKLNKEDDILFFDQSKTTLKTNEVILEYPAYMNIGTKTNIEFKNVTNYSNSFNRYKELIEEKYNEKVNDYAISIYDELHENGYFSYDPNPNDNRQRKMEKIIYDLTDMFYDKNNGYFEKNGFQIKNEVIEENKFVLEKEIVTVEGNYQDSHEIMVKEIALKYAFSNYQEAYENGFVSTMYFESETMIEKIESYKFYLEYSIIQKYFWNGTYTKDTFGDIFNESLKNSIIDNIESFNEQNGTQKFEFFMEIDSDIMDKLNGNTKVVGIKAPNYDLKDGYLPNDRTIIMSDEIHNIINELFNTEPYTFFITDMPKSKSEIRKLVNLNYEEFDDNNYYSIKNEVSPTIDFAQDFVKDTTKIFMYIGLGFAAFSALMLSNFIGTSVSHKKREIGILRALGARSKDVYEIFLHESLLIAGINFLVSVIATIITIKIINNSLRMGVGLKLTLFNFGIRQVILLLLVSGLVAILASFFPVYKFAKKKPVDAISDK